MYKSKITELNEFGQSIWLDYISRPLIKSGKLKEMVDLGLRGMTSNPTIFDKSISSSGDYDKQIAELRRSGKKTFDIYDGLTIADIQDAADIFKPVYDKTKMLDGYVSLEINPRLAFKTKETIEEGKRLHKKVNRPNVMLKVPSTAEGFEAVEELTACGINVNVTLIFSLGQYVRAAQAYIEGIKRLLEDGGDARGVRSVASVFVSRIDTVVDKQLKEEFAPLRGKAAVANSAVIYGKFLDIFSSEDFKNFKAKGANMQRALWGSTGTKNPAYSDIKYITELIAKDTINTAPQKTLDAFMDHGAVKDALGRGIREAQKILDELRGAGIDIEAVCAELLEAGVSAFEKSFNSLLNSIERKTKSLCKEHGGV